MWIEFDNTIVIVLLKSRASYPIPVTRVKKLMEELVSSLRIYRTNRPQTCHNLHRSVSYMHMYMLMVSLSFSKVKSSIKHAFLMHSNTFSSLRSFPVVKNSSIFSAIFAPTPSWEEKAILYENRVLRSVRITFEDLNTSKNKKSVPVSLLLPHFWSSEGIWRSQMLLFWTENTRQSINISYIFHICSYDIKSYIIRH